jgi:hypothetical protein
MSMVIEIQLTRKQITIIDDCDADLANLNWYANPQHNCFYAKRKARKETAQTTETLHRVILSRMLNRTLTTYDYVDHINHDTLDNRRNNLRLVTPKQNRLNTTKRSNNTSGFIGVSWKKQRCRWKASIGVDGKNYHLGYYTKPEDAAHAYDIAAQIIYGEFAYLNFK